MRRECILIVSIGLAGCAADPSVRYVEATSPAVAVQASSHLIDSFYLQKNDVHVELRDGGGTPAKPAPSEMIVTNTRIEDIAHKFLLLRDDAAWTRTTISLAKVENSDLIESAGVEVEDRRMELIQTIGAAAKTLLPILVGASPGRPDIEDELIAGCDSFPMRACDLPQAAALDVGSAAARRGPKRGLQAFWGPVSPSAIPIADFLAHLDARHVHGLYYASCRSLELRYAGESATVEQGSDDGAKLRIDGQIHYDWKGKVSDPRWVEFVRFPRKGNIRMHSQCGASITSEADPTQSNAALLNAVLSQAVAVKGAVDAH
jgi:hypothetical protein